MNTENRYQETDLGNVSPNPRGEYTPGTEYEYLDLVTFDGGSYICIAELGTTTSISPESGKNTDFWQCMTIPGDMTPEYVAMHDRVVNLSEQVGADAEEVRVAEQNVSGMKENVTQMQEQTRQSAESAEQNKDSAAGYAASADASRQAAETSEQNINAQVAGFDAHVAEKTSEAEQSVEASRIVANKSILAQQEQSVNEVARVGIEAVSTAQAAAQTATEKAQAAATSEKNAAASETAAKLSKENATKMAEQVATDKEQVAYDRTAVENAKQEISGSVAQIEQNTQGITELKGDIYDYYEKQDLSLQIGMADMNTGVDKESALSCITPFIKTTLGFRLVITCQHSSGQRIAVLKYDKLGNFKGCDKTHWDTAMEQGDIYSYDCEYGVTEYIRIMLATKSWVTITDSIKESLQKSLKCTNLDINIFSLLSTFEYITPEMFGGVGDGITDDTTAFLEMLNSGYKKVYLQPNKLYMVGLLTFSNLDGVFINGNGSTIKLNIHSDEEVKNVGFFKFYNCKNITIKNVVFDGGNEWIERPFADDDLYTSYSDTRKKSYDGLFLDSCQNVLIENCIGTNSRTGFFITDCENLKMKSCKSMQTMADGVFITGKTKKCFILNHYCECVNDDNFTCIGYYNDDSKNPSYVTFKDCNSENSFGALICLYGSTYSKAINCNGKGNKYAPFKTGSMYNASSDWYCIGHHQYICDCSVILSDKIETHGESSVPIINGAPDSRPHDISLENCSAFYTGSEIYTFNINNADIVCLKGNTFEGVTFQVNNGENIDLFGNIFKLSRICTLNSCVDIRIISNLFDNTKTTAPWNGNAACAINLMNNTNVIFDNNNYNVKENAEGSSKNIFLNTANTGVLIDTNELYVTTNTLADLKFKGVFENTNNYDASIFRNGQLVLLNDDLLVVSNGTYVNIIS